MRLFVAVPIDRTVSAAIAAWMESLDIPGRLVPVANWHLTLRFLGDVDPVGADRLLAELARSNLPDPFRIRFGAVGGFPRPKKATVAFIGVDRGEPRLEGLAATANEAAAAAGLGFEDRPFHPHLTLSRVRPPRDIRVLTDSAADVSMHVDSVCLYRSHLGSDGTRYEELERFPLS